MWGEKLALGSYDWSLLGTKPQTFLIKVTEYDAFTNWAIFS